MSAGALRELALGPDELGESIGWDGEDGSLLRVDILGGLVHRVADPLAPEPRSVSFSFEGEVGFALPRRDGGLVVAAELTIWLLDPDGSRRVLLELDDRPANRWNDAVCDARGRLWAGTMARDRRTGAAALYRIDPDGARERVLSELTISNGLGWLGSQCLHFIDSPTQRVDARAGDPEAGRIVERHPFAEVAAADGMPDGLCVDAEGGTWVALFGGGRVVRFDRGGSRVEEIALPVPHPTNVCLGGADGRDVFITTARHRLSAEERGSLPAAGRVFHARSEVAGQPAFAFGG